jgi:hypothetical protein
MQRVAGVEDAIDIAVGGSRACAVTRAGAVSCWELDASMTPARIGSAYRIAGITSAVRVAVGTNACVVDRAGDLTCWGGDGPPNATLLPRLDPGSAGSPDHFRATPMPAQLVHVAVGVDDVRTTGDALCVRFHAGRVACFAAMNLARPEHDAELGDVAGANGSVELAVGNHHACVIAHDGAVRCWGDDSRGQLGTGERQIDRRTFAPVRGLRDVVTIASSDTDLCALRRNGTVLCWGGNVAGCCGPGRPSRLSPTAVAGIDSATTLVLGSGRGCVIQRDTSVRCWGRGTLFETPVLESYDVPSLRGATVLGLSSDGSGEMREDDDLGAVLAVLPTGVRRWSRSVPHSVEVDGGTADAVQFVGRCVRRTNGVVDCGAGVPMATDAIDVAVDRTRYAIVHATGRVTQGARRFEDPLDSVTDARGVMCSNGACCVWRSSGAVTCSPDAFAETDIASLRDVVGLAAAGGALCALVRDGTVRCAGSNLTGMFGDGVPIAREEATPVAASTVP